MKDLVENDMPEAVDVLKDIKKSGKECLQHLRKLITKVKNETVTDEGISFLDVKNQLMASYMTNLCFLMDKKTCGKSVKDDASIDRLIEMRTVLEKMRPIEHKLKYQINKVVTAYKEGKMDPSDPRKFKPNFGAFANMPENSSSDEENKKEKSQDDGPQLYVAPKVAPAHYSDDETHEERIQKQSDKKRKRSISAAMLKDMREQYTDLPVEVHESWDLHRLKENKKDKERIEYEENNFVRLSLSKKESAGRKKMGTMSALGTIADFDSFGVFDDEAEDGAPSKKKRGMSKSKKSKGKKGSGKKGGKNKRR